MAIALVGTPQSAGIGGTNDNKIAAPAINLVTGNAVIVGVKCEGAVTIDSVTDTAGNTYTGLPDAPYTTDGHCRLFYCKSATGNASNVVQGNFSGSVPYRGITVWQVSGHDTGAGFLVDSDVQTGNGTASMTSPAITAGDAAFFFIGDYAGTTATPGTGWTEDADDSAASYKAYHRIDSPGGTYSASGTLAVSTNYGLGILSIAAAASGTAEQARSRFRNDDGSETTATWAAAENANITAAVAQALRLRVQVQGVGDPASAAYTLRYQKNGSGGYVAVPVGATTTPALSFGATGGFAYSGTNPAPSYPAGITADSELVLIVGQKPSSANGGTVTTPTGWTLQASLTGSNDGNTGGYTTTLGADTGNCNIYVYTKDSVSGSESGTLTVTTGTNNVAWACIVRLQKSVPGTVSWAAATGKDTSAGSVSIATGALDLAAGDYLIGGMVIPTDVTTPSQFSAHALSQSGTTFGTVSEIGEADSTTGNDIGGYLIQAPVSSGSGTGAVTMTATAGGTTTNVRGPGFVLRARPVTATNEVYVATSSNITAGGQATTQQLTAGSGSFTTGRMWDDENGSDSIDIGNNGYTELEWNLATQAPAATDDYFDFRVYAGSSPLDTYTVTPRWTIGAGVQTYNVSLSESATAADAVSSLGQFTRALSESVSAVDTVSALAVFARSIAETVTPVDNINGGSAFAGSLSESVSPTDSMALAYITNPGLAESLTVLDTVASVMQGVAALTEAVSAADAPTAAKVSNPSLSEAVSASDSLTGGLALLAALSESAPVADVLASVQQAVAALAESLTLTDTLSADQQGVISVSMSESMAVSDAVGSALNGLAALAETVTLSDLVVRNWITTAGLAESVAPSDVLTATRAIAAALAETTSLVDSLGSLGVFSVQITEAAALIDAPQAAALLSAALSEAISPTDIIAAIAASYPGDPRRTFTVSGGRGLVVQAGDRVVVVTRNDRTIH